MPESAHLSVAIVDYGMGNLFSVQHACEHVGLSVRITNSRHDILSAAAVILPGVGAFGTAMDALMKLDLVQPLRDVAKAGTPLLGICLGMQLLMTESREFGLHQGLDLVKGEVVRMEVDERGRYKVPQVGWNRVVAVRRDRTSVLLDGLADGEFMYFVHSFYCRPVEPGVALTTTCYSGVTFCSSLRQNNIFACQFHPERSGHAGLRLYRNWAAWLIRTTEESRAGKAGSEIRIA